jgi:hypothetical protein
MHSSVSGTVGLQQATKEAMPLIRMVLSVSLGVMPYAEPADGQAVDRAAVHGSIVDASTGAPLSNVLVMLERATDDSTAAARTPLAPRMTRSDTSGVYVFGNIAPGRYTLQAERIGYRSQRIMVTVRSADDPRVSLGLAIEPVALEPLDILGAVGGNGDRSFARAARGDRAMDARINAERTRQRLFLAGDVRTLTHGDVVEAVTLGETDLFRALQRMPGVSTVDEYSAELWTRGAGFDQMRVYVDGVPLFNPLHAAGAFGAVSADAIGAAYLHPGAQPLSFEGGAAGSLELRTRAGEDDEMRAVGELSLVSARLAVDDEAGDGERAFMIAARRTYLDLITRLAERVFGMDNVSIPYDFLDVTGRYDERLGEQRALEASALLQLDAVKGDVPDVVHGVRARWGSGLARVSLLTPVHGRRSRHTIGISTFASRVRTAEVEQSDLNAPGASPSSNALTHLLLRGELERGDDDAWAAGYEVSRVQVDYTGPAPRASLRSSPMNDTLAIEGSLVRAALWLERRWQIGSVAVSGGTRIETGSGAVDTSPVRLAPRIAARWQLAPGTSMSSAFARGFQYEQAIAPAGVSPLENFASELVWVVAGDDVPVLRSSIATAGLEHWLSSRWLVGATAWVRRSSGVAHTDPTPGLDVGRQAFTIGGANARGVDVSIRRLAGRWTGSLAYSHTVADATAAGFDFPADEDRRNVLDLTSMMQLGRGWVWSAAYTHATGAPYTRVHPGETDCGEDGVCVWRVPPSRGQPNAHRRAAASTLDFSLDWSRRMRRWTLGGFVQLRNVLGSDNQGRYAGYEPPHCQSGCENGGGADIDGYDKFHPGLPRLPLIGFRVTF